MPLGATIIDPVIQRKAMSAVIVAAFGLNQLSCLLELPLVHPWEPLNLHCQRW